MTARKPKKVRLANKRTALKAKLKKNKKCPSWGIFVTFKDIRYNTNSATKL